MTDAPAHRGLRRAGRRAARRARPSSRRRGALPPGAPAQPARADRPGRARRSSPPPRARGARCSSPTPTAAPAGTSTACSPTIPASARLPGAHCYEVFAGARRVRRAARRGAGHLLPHRLPRPALRRPRVAGPRARPPSRAARRRTSATTGASCCSRSRPTPTSCAAGRRAAERLGPGVRAPPRRARTTWPAAVPVDRPERRLMPRRSGAGEVVVILWRDIPAQVNGQLGRERHQVLLSPKFQRAVDRAKRKAQDPHRQRGHRPVAPREHPGRRRPRGERHDRGDAEAARLERRVLRRTARAAWHTPAAGSATSRPGDGCGRAAPRRVHAVGAGGQGRRRHDGAGGGAGHSAPTSTPCAAGAASAAAAR